MIFIHTSSSGFGEWCDYSIIRWFWTIHPPVLFGQSFAVKFMSLTFISKYDLLFEDDTESKKKKKKKKHKTRDEDSDDSDNDEVKHKKKKVSILI